MLGLEVGAVIPIVSDDPRMINQAVLSKRPWFLVSSAITSGILTKVSVLEAVGGFDETLFVEGADLELTSRMSSLGWPLYCINRVLIIQDFENPVIGEKLPVVLGSKVTRLRSVVRVSLGNANVFRTRLSTYNAKRWAELKVNLRALRTTKGLRRQAALTSTLNHLESAYIRFFCTHSHQKIKHDVEN